jgi:hypothetical protein|tara:strand:- start:1114 stop:1560 length:447 start_codon:yes stop_codon:yes gene_type:complete
MILISHRGNIRGKTEAENNPRYVFDAMHEGYNVEVDVWYVKDNFYLGHDKPQYKIQAPFITDEKIWCHCKNIEAIIRIKEINEKFGYNIHYFWHQEDDITLTSQGHIWAHSNKQPIKNSIAVLPEIHQDDLSVCKGICSDYIINYHNE